MFIGWLTDSYAMAAPLPPVALSADDEARLAQREVVTRVLDPSEGDGMIAIVDVKAGVRKTMDAMMDFPARKAEATSLKDVKVYEMVPAPEHQGVEWDLSVLGTKVTFNLVYDVDRDNVWVTYHLDPTKTNDVRVIEGTYQAYAVGNGLTRLIYRNHTETTQYIPGFVKHWLADDEMGTLLGCVRDRAEASQPK